MRIKTCCSKFLHTHRDQERDSGLIIKLAEHVDDIRIFTVLHNLGAFTFYLQRQKREEQLDNEIRYFIHTFVWQTHVFSLGLMGTWTWDAKLFQADAWIRFYTSSTDFRFRRCYIHIEVFMHFTTTGQIRQCMEFQRGPLIGCSRIATWEKRS